MRLLKLVICFGALIAVRDSQSQGYVEAGACAVCHRAIAESYAQTGMARTFGASPHPVEGRFEHSASGQVFTILTRQGTPFLRRQLLDGTNQIESQVDYWFGSGRHARSYISRTSSDELIELPVTWYSEKNGYWAMSPGYDRPDHAGFSRKLTYRCMSCHNGVIELPNPSWETGTRFPGRLPEGIDCQRCHGPGKLHIDIAKQGAPMDRVRAAIVNPTRLPADRRMEVCLQCHLETTILKLPPTLLRAGHGVFSYRPGEAMSDYILHFDRAAPDTPSDRLEFAGAAYQLRKSACYKQSGGTLVCTTCHNPHEPSDTPAAQQRYVQACQKCHQQKLSAMITARSHPTREDCATCHLPRRRPSDAIHTQITDHFIQARPRAEPSTPLTEFNDSNTPPYRGPVEFYLPSKLSDAKDQELYWALAQVKHDSNLTAGLRALEAAIRKYSPPQAEFYSELAEAYRRAGKPTQASEFYGQANRREEGDWRIPQRWGSLLISMSQLERAATTLDRAYALAPKEPVVLETISNLRIKQGRVFDGIELLRMAISIEPNAASLHATLGARLIQVNDVSAAEKAWREAVRLRPEVAANCLNLANLLARKGSTAEAEFYFKAALRNAPEFADTHLAYAITLEAQKRMPEAERELRSAIENSPDFHEAHLRLGLLLQKRGDNVSATHHFEKALESPEPRIREAAREKLRQP